MGKNRGSINRPPILDGSNYDYWKARMIAFIKSMDQGAWRAIVTGWNHPMVTTEDGCTSLKGVADWSAEEETIASANSKALNAIFNGVDQNMFKLINTCTEAKQAWEILQTAHEGTSKVRMSKLQLLTTKFENLRMDEDETISEFNTRLRDIVNSSFALGEKISEEKIARKILRSLPKRFNIKVTTIEESQDLSTMKVDELIGSLQTFEMAINEKLEKEERLSNDMALLRKLKKEWKKLDRNWRRNVSNKLSNNNSQRRNLGEDNLSEAITLIDKKFNKSLNKLKRQWGTNVLDKIFNNSAQGKVRDVPDKMSNIRRGKEEDKSYLERNIRCFECEGFGHIKAECLTFLTKQKRELSISWTNFDDESEGETTNMIRALIGKSEIDSFGDEDQTEEELNDTYRKMTTKWEESSPLVEEQKRIIKGLIQEQLISTVTHLEEEVTLLESKLTNITKTLRMLNKGSDTLDELLEVGKMTRDMGGLGFDRCSKKEVKSAPEKMIPPMKKSQYQMSNHMSQHPVQHKYSKSTTKPQLPAQLKKQMSSHMSQHPVQQGKDRNVGQLHKQQKKHIPRTHLKKLFSQNRRAFNRCDHCGRSGHAMKECFKLHGYPQKPKSPSQNKRKTLPPRMKYKEALTKVWKPTPPQQAHTSPRITPSKNWYFDSGCSKHMTGDKRYLRELKSHLKGSVTFGDGVKGRVIGIGKLAGPNTPCLDDVLLVEGLTANLISISQLCEQGLKVHFNNHECTIANDQEVVMKGTKSSDKCYTWTPQDNGPEIACLSAKEELDKMSHQMFQHLYNGQGAEEILVGSVRVPLGIHTLKNVS
ncbi:gag-protease polyprotein [Trifolium repens]|nr:gag-protease polyprotein [Trifolium repens]